MVTTFSKNVEYLAERIVRPVFNVIDSVASKVTRAYLKQAKVGIQLVEPHDHRANAKERAI